MRYNKPKYICQCRKQDHCVTNLLISTSEHYVFKRVNYTSIIANYYQGILRPIQGLKQTNQAFFAERGTNATPSLSSSRACKFCSLI
jgi:hypothetical protein